MRVRARMRVRLSVCSLSNSETYKGHPIPSDLRLRKAIWVKTQLGIIVQYFLL